jgi:phosphate transport system permease protein
MAPPDAPLTSGELLDKAPRRSARVRNVREAFILASLVGCGLFSVFITLSIVYVLFSEAAHFFTATGPGFENVSLGNYLTGTEWAPLLGEDKRFGMWPLVTGTLMVTGIAALIALPLGLVTAIYLSEYAPSRVRASLKPVLEILAGVPTVVYGFFALTVITPALRGLCNWLFGVPVFEFFNSTSAGVAVGIMCLPTVVSLSEDALRAVPNSLREGAYGLGCTKFDVAVKVVVPAALSGVVAAFLLAVARAVGETMIVALAAGGLAQIASNPTEGSQTMTAYMVQIFLGDAPFGSVEYYSSYTVGATLFIMTLILTLLGNWVLAKFREEYE